MGAGMTMAKRRLALNEPHLLTAQSDGILTLDTDMRAPLKALRVEFEPVQDLHGYENPWPGGGGKNLFDNDGEYQNGKFVNSSGAIVNSTGTPIQRLYTQKIAVTPGEKYTVSSVASTASYIRVIQYTSADAFIGRILTAQEVNPSVTITADTNAAYIIINPDETCSNIQVEKSDVATAFAPYSNVCTISGWDGANVERTGKNLANQLAVSGPRISWDETMQAVKFSDYVTASESTVIARINRPGQIILSYDIRHDGSSTGDREIVIIYYTDGTRDRSAHGSSASGRWQHVTITSKPNTAVRSVAYGYLYGSAGFPSYLKNVQVEMGATETSYEPYSGSTTPISWADEAGTVYGGTLAWEKDGTVKLTKTHESVNLSSLTWQRRSTTPYRFSASMPSGKHYTNAVDVSQHKCSIFPTAYTSGVNNTKEGYLGIYRIPTQTGADNTIYLRFADTVTTLTELNAFLAETNPQYCYPLATPITYTLTPQEALRTLRGENNIWSDANGAISATYWKH